jgi:hypothetical protein
MPQGNKKRKRVLRILGGIVLLIAVLAAWYWFKTRVVPPAISDRSATERSVTVLPGGARTIPGGWLKQNRFGLWELYVEGAPFERGVVNGKLTANLIRSQESAFIRQIRTMIPSDFYLRFLKYFIYWFNRDLDEYVTDEFKKEIYGVSLSASDSFEFIGSAYQRMLNYHSAHDIGHALQELSLVGCTSVGVWGSRSADSSLVIGRNFDFYAGDEFAVNKIVCFEKPDSGHAFMMVTWGGMIGTVSGMNEAGLTVTINAAVSEIPWSARTPISILAREILQYAGNIDEAWKIAEKRKTFISESLLIGSAADNKAAIIEKSPYGMGLVVPKGDEIICANHFQSETFTSDPLNRNNIRDNATRYRFLRVREAIGREAPVGPLQAAAVLRDQRGLRDAFIGMGNEKAINQLIAHHSVIFMPRQRLAWVSTDPWQLGTYVCYDLSEIFNTFARHSQPAELSDPGRNIPPDPFLESDQYNRFREFRSMKSYLKKVISEEKRLADERSFMADFTASNPGFYETWALAGDYYFAQQEWDKARENYMASLRRMVPRWSEKQAIISKLADCNIRLKNN